MMKRTLLLAFFVLPLLLLAQKKPLDHSVYDCWESIPERLLSNDGQWTAYAVNPQEGDGRLFLRSTSDTSKWTMVPRGYAPVISDDSKFLVCRVRAPFRETREAKIKKKKPEDFPKDSLAIIEISSFKTSKVAAVKSFRLPERSGLWMAYQKERSPARMQGGGPTQKTVDSLRKTIDSLVMVVKELKSTKSSKDGQDADEDPSSAGAAGEGSDLIVRNLASSKEKTFKSVTDYFFNRYGQKLLIRTVRSARDSGSVNAVLLYDLAKNRIDTLSRGGIDYKQLSISDNGWATAFLADKDTTKSLVRTYGLYLYRNGEDSAALLVDKNSEGMKLGMSISENGAVAFSRSGKRLFFGLAPLPQPKDTSLVDIDLVKLDIWHYSDDYLQPQQLVRLPTESKRSYGAMYDLDSFRLMLMAGPGLPELRISGEGDGRYFLALTDTGRRVSTQWTGRTKSDLYAIDTKTGKNSLIRKNFEGFATASPSGNYILMYNAKEGQYYTWDGVATRKISGAIKTKLNDEENDVPDYANPYGILGWHEKDSFLYVYDRYRIWQLDPAGKKAPVSITPMNTKDLSYRYIKVDPDERFIRYGQPLYLRVTDEKKKKSGLMMLRALPMEQKPVELTEFGSYSYASLLKARDKDAFLFSKENFTQSPDLYFKTSSGGPVQLTRINQQQDQYNWGTVSLYEWKTFDGKNSQGLLYKPQDFDSTKKYPMLIYFYEKMSDNLYRYFSPAPSASSINIPLFVSRGYLVFVPDISYQKGHPGKSAYNYIVSGAQALAKKRWVDAANIGIQGQSWGGYQVAYLITATNMFKAAWAGAPVVNMFSAYGGIRWGSGVNRQFQYEHSQSRIGATPWERPDLYIENSPFFHLQKVKTPLVIMSNDADDAVPWYQGIEFFTAMRRLDKKVWLLNYNGEVHNLMDRKNRKDISIRQTQYFDWLLKGEKPARWITEGLPATKKGKDWGLTIVDEDPNLQK